MEQEDFMSRSHKIYKTIPSKFHYLQKQNGLIPLCRQKIIEKI